MQRNWSAQKICKEIGNKSNVTVMISRASGYVTLITLMYVPVIDRSLKLSKSHRTVELGCYPEIQVASEKGK